MKLRLILFTIVIVVLVGISSIIFFYFAANQKSSNSQNDVNNRGYLVNKVQDNISRYNVVVENTSEYFQIQVNDSKDLIAYLMTNDAYKNLADYYNNIAIQPNSLSTNSSSMDVIFHSIDDYTSLEKSLSAVTIRKLHSKDGDVYQAFFFEMKDNSIHFYIYYNESTVKDYSAIDLANRFNIYFRIFVEGIDIGNKTEGQKIVDEVNDGQHVYISLIKK